MTSQNKSTSTGFCPGCGMQLFSQWGFCPRCGRTLDDLHVSLWENPEGSLTSRSSGQSREASRALELLRARLVAEAEQKLRASMRETPADIELRIILAGVLFQRYDVQEAGALYDEALALAPDDFIVRLRRAEYLARLGRFTEALVDLNAARSLSAPDFPTLLYCQELQRWVANSARRSMTAAVAPTGPARWLATLGANARRRLSLRKLRNETSVSRNARQAGNSLLVTAMLSATLVRALLPGGGAQLQRGPLETVRLSFANQGFMQQISVLVPQRKSLAFAGVTTGRTHQNE